MAIREKNEDGVLVYEVAVNLRSKVEAGIRVQKMRGGITTLKAAQAAERQLTRICLEELTALENRAPTLGEVLKKWELAHRQTGYHKVGMKQIQKTTVWDTTAVIHNFAESWLKMDSRTIGPGEVRKTLNAMAEEGYSWSRLKALKSAVNVVYKWGIEEGLIKGIPHSPAQGMEVGPRVEAIPLILNVDEIRSLLTRARQDENEWYPIWAMALFTGMRSGELYALRWESVDLTTRMIMVSVSYNGRMKKVKSTKSNYWRKVPINDELYSLLSELKNSDYEGFVLPRLNKWKRGEAAKVLREYCGGIGIKEVTFHALRACFATHLLNAKVASPTVKKICGWSDEKVMARYIRIAGLDVEGATSVLDFGLTGGARTK